MYIVCVWSFALASWHKQEWMQWTTWSLTAKLKQPVVLNWHEAITESSKLSHQYKTCTFHHNSLQWILWKLCLSPELSILWSKYVHISEHQIYICFISDKKKSNFYWKKKENKGIIGPCFTTKFIVFLWLCVQNIIISGF